VTASRLRRNGKVAAVLSDAQRDRSERTAITQDAVVRALAAIAFGDIRSLFDKDTQRLKHPSDLDDQAAASIDRIHIITRGARDGQTAHVLKIERLDQIAALALLARHLGMLNDKLKPDGKLGVEKLVDERANDETLLARMRELLAKADEAEDVASM
jgi:phage terminase small subunit